MHLYLQALCSGLFLIGQVNASPAPIVEERGTCNQDNLLNALENPNNIQSAYQFCSAYISVPEVTIVTTYTDTCILSSYWEVESIIHPLYLYNLQPMYTIGTPISYNSADPTPSTVPGNPQSYGWPYGEKVRRGTGQTSSHSFSWPFPTQTPMPTPSPNQELKRQGGDVPLPSFLATTYPASRLSSACSCLSVPAASTSTYSDEYFSIDTTTTCTSYVPTTVATYPAFCAPSLQVNAPAPNSAPGFRVVPSFPVDSKMDCCAACTAVFNCVWWKFDFGTPGDGWQPGMCHYAYYIGTNDDEGGAPAICPNGAVQGITNFSPDYGNEANNNNPGYNFGPCGGAPNEFESNEDFGYPNDYYDNQCGLPWNEPVYSCS